MRPSLASSLVAIAMGALVFIAGWGVQAGFLPAPGRAAIIAARAAGWLSRYRRTNSTISIERRSPVHATCVETWLRGADGDAHPETLLRLGGGSIVVALQQHRLDVFGVQHVQPAWLTRAELELAGCPRLLGDALTVAAQSPRALRVIAAHDIAQRTLELEVLAPMQRLSVRLASRTDKPIGLSISTHAWYGHSTIQLAPVTHALLSGSDLG
jgi:hypothetical protein